MTEPRHYVGLSRDERRELTALAGGSGGSAGRRRRASAVLLLGTELPAEEIARQTGYTIVHVSRLRARFLAGRVAGLADRPKSGRPPRVPFRSAMRVVALALRAAVRGRRPPAIPALAHRTAVSLHRVREILSEHRLGSPTGVRSPLTPLRVEGIAGVHLRARDPAFVFSCNSARARPGNEALPEFTSVFAAVAGGLRSSRERSDDPRADVFRFLDALAVDSGAELHAILGERALYPRRGAQDYEARHPHVRLHFTPRGARWEEMVGVWLNLLPRQVTHWASYRPVPRLVRALRDHLIAGAWPPFIWISGARGGLASDSR